MWRWANKLAMLTPIWQLAAFWRWDGNSALALIGAALSRYVAAELHKTAAFVEPQS